MTAAKTIEIWTLSKQDDQARAALPKLGSSRGFEVSHVDPTVLTANLSSFLTHFQSLPLDAESSHEGKQVFSVQEIELNLGISGKGGVALIGKVEAGFEAGIKVKLTRKSAVVPK